MNKSLKISLYFIFAIICIATLILVTEYVYDQTDAQQAVKHTTDHVDINNNTTRKLATSPIKPPTTTSGFDWSLPANTQIEPNSGLIGMRNQNIDYVKNQFAIVRWDKANPQKGKYNFSSFEKQLQDFNQQKALVRLEVNSICEAPKWARKTLRVLPDKSLVFWDENYLNLLKPFIKEFAKHYANDPRVIGVQLGIADGEYHGNSCDFSNKDGWGEFWMAPQSIEKAQKQFGFTPDVFEKQSKAIIDLYVAAFGKNKGKLAFTNIGPNFSWGSVGESYNQKLKSISKHVWKTGVGNRDGHIEIWMRFIDKAYGVHLASVDDGSCKMDFDEAYANTIRGRYWGTENEFYGDKLSDTAYVEKEHGPYKNQPYRFLVSSLRALQMRRNYFSIASESMTRMEHPTYKTQQFLTYLTKVMGKQIENTPDAFILLGERYISQDHASNFAAEACVKNSAKGVAVRSFGRWLSEKSRSKRALKVSMPASENYWGQNYYMPDGVDYEYSARKSKQFSFDINDQLIKKRCKTNCNLDVKITFKDTAKTSLNIGYGKEEKQTFKTKGDNKIKTVTFNVNSRFQNDFKGSDFMIDSKMDELTLIMIRVNFL